jgi:hypothetical protein
VVALALTPDLVAYAERVLGLPGVQIFRVPEQPTPAPSVQREPFSGTRVSSLADASKQAGFTVRAPSELGEPDAIFVETAPTRVTLVYRSPGAGERAGIPLSQVADVSAIVVEFRGTLDQNVMGKAIGPGTTLEPVTLSGGSGFWLAGAPHQFFYRDPSGTFVPETLRLAGNTLLWEQGGITYRLEAQVSKDRALGIAASLR